MSEFWLPVVAVCLLTGFFTSRVAQRKGRDPVVWFFIGFMLSIVGVSIATTLKRRSRNASS